MCQIDLCRFVEGIVILSVLRMLKKFGVPACSHVGGVGLCEYHRFAHDFRYPLVICQNLADWIAIYGCMVRNVLVFFIPHQSMTWEGTICQATFLDDIG